MKHIRLPRTSLLRRLFKYNLKTGELFWRISSGSVKSYLPVKRNGRTQVCIKGRLYLISRIIWKIKTGDDPGKFEIDHRDLDRTNDCWRNLRLATSKQNGHNKRRSRNNTSGYKGVSKNGTKWRARAESGGKKSLGDFDTPREAGEAYIKFVLAERGEFARY